ncbi:hypothetical protein [Streptomyces lydicus]|uniref:hypothetical protein n=1 Tax=Streptomyces lydicus TaxID=47763 RepID=UPI0013DDC55E|nr:hypothetical protein [Streptomyces lydicus]
MPEPQFKREADMLTPIASQATQLMPGSSETLFEVQTIAGIPDIVFIDFDTTTLEHRKETSKSFIVDFSDMCVLQALDASNHEVITSAELASRLPLSAKYISSTVLPRLTEYGYVRKHSRGKWISESKFKSLAKRICTIEVKIRDWRSGYSQTLRHRASTDLAWLVLDSTYSTPATEHREWFKRAGIGLATLDNERGVKRVVSPKLKRGHKRNVYRELLAERAAHLYATGQTSGSIGLVFGVDLTTTTGPDPRRPNVGERHSSPKAVHLTTS